MVKVILVDKRDRKIGIGEKLKVHKEGKLHRVFSIFIFNQKGEILLQKRAKRKYHSGGLWSNTCCSHPKPGENILKAAKRRLKEEMGIECKLKKIFKLIYKAKVGDLIEYEFDHILVGKFDGNPRPNRNEVEDWKWIGSKELEKDLKFHSERYTEWFKIIFPKLKKRLRLDLKN
jgi:isopentenyl-diphosphate delta-isomerase